MAERQVTEFDQIGFHLRRLVGRWEGQGSGRFPTIDSFDYREVFHANVRQDGEGTVHYEQQTWRIGGGGGAGDDDGDGDGEALHWESGFLMAREDGKVEMLNAQESRRVEVLVGELFQDDASPGACVLRLRSVVQAHDDRMLAATRVIRFDDRDFRYEVAMSTTRVPDLEHHLTGTLTRS